MAASTPVQAPKTATASAVKPVATVAASVYRGPQDFLATNQIHIEDGSIFTQDHHLIIHPRETAAANHSRLFAKIVKHYSLPSPSYYGFFPRNVVALSLAQFMPLSATARAASLQEAINKLQQEVDKGMHPDHADQELQYAHPFTALVKQRLEKPPIDPADREFLTNATGIYLVVNQALKDRNRPQEAAAYVHAVGSKDAVLSDLAPKLGVHSEQFVTALQKGGIDGLASLLNVDAKIVSEIKAVSAMMIEHQFSDNLIASWEVGRQIPGLKQASIEQKLAAGTLERAGTTLHQLVRHVAPDTRLPADIARDEKQILSMIRELPPILQQALYYSGAELGFCHGYGLQKIEEGARGVLGLNRHVPFQHGDSNGLRQILVSNVEQSRESRRTFHHEVNHLFFPKQLNPEAVKQMDTLMLKGVERLKGLKQLLDQWKIAETDADRSAVEKQINDGFKVGNIDLNAALARGGNNPHSMDTLRNWVDYSLSNLNPHSLRLSKSYDSPEIRAAEIISRFSELMFVDLKDHPTLLSFVAPEMTVLYHDHYLPHIQKQVEAYQSEQQHLPPEIRFMGLPNQVRLPKTQVHATQLKEADITASTVAFGQKSELIASTQALSEMPHNQVAASALQYMQRIESGMQLTDPSYTVATR